MADIGDSICFKCTKLGTILCTMKDDYDDEGDEDALDIVYSCSLYEEVKEDGGRENTQCN